MEEDRISLLTEGEEKRRKWRKEKLSATKVSQEGKKKLIYPQVEIIYHYLVS